MTISVGEKIPNVEVMLATAEGPQKAMTHDILGAGKAALFAVPGAFTPTCSAKHLPGFVNHADALMAKGVGKIVCMSVNDAFVMKAWAQSQNALDKIVMLADGNGAFSKALGLEMDASGFGMGVRSKRFSAIIEDGVVKQLNVEAPGAFEVSSADYMIHGGAAETFGLVIAEAICSGLPIIVPHIGGAVDLAHPTYAEVYRAGDPEAFHAALRRIVARDRHELSVAARAKAHRLGAPEEHFRTLLAHYARLAEKKAVQAAA